MIFGKPFFQGETTVDKLIQIMRILGTPDNNQLQYLNKNGSLNCQFPEVKALTINKAFSGKPKDLINLLNKIFIYEPHKRISALEIMTHPFFDDLKNLDLTQNGKYIIPNVFDFTIKEISLYRNKDILKKIIPEWSENFKDI